MKLAHTIAFGIAVALSSPIAAARGVSPYLPLNLSPAIERQIERVLILAGKPVMRRPIAAAVVLDALPAACERDRATCEQVRRYLQNYMKTWGVTSLDVQVATSNGDSNLVLPNRHGEQIDSSWRVNASAFYQPNDYILVTAGGIAYDGEAVPTGSLLSFGFDFAQLDIGWRDHWLSPLSDSSSLISTEAPTMPSVTLSNYEPISPLGISYEVFAAEMSRQEGIAHESGPTSGKPRIAGLHGSLEPLAGFAIGGNRITQYGGGERGGGSLSDFVDALTTTSNEQDSLGQPTADVNRVASITSSTLFPGGVPFGVYFEFSGEDNTYEGKYRLGDTNLSLGLDLPVLWRDFDATYEISEWQTIWYTHHLYAEGLTHRGRVIGHWFGDHRIFGDALGGRSHMLQVGWQLPRGDYARATYRNLDIDSRWAFDGIDRPYRTMQMLEVDYSTDWKGFPVQAQLLVGRDVFGESFARIGASFDFARTSARGIRDPMSRSRASHGTELFVAVGAQYSETREILFLPGMFDVETGPETNYLVGVGARRPVGARSDLGVRLEIGKASELDLMSFRAVDYRFRLNRHFGLNVFVGVGRVDLNLPAYGYHWGVGVQAMDVLPGWDIGLDYRYHDKMTRDKGLATDPESHPNLPRRVVDITGIGVYLSKRW